MLTLIEKLAQSTHKRSTAGSSYRDDAAIAEIPSWAAEPAAVGFRLGAPQLRALEM